jgi:hypothetical protein
MHTLTIFSKPQYPKRECGRGLCRKVAFWRQNPKISYWKINGLRASTFLFSVICDRARWKTEPRVLITVTPEHIATRAPR